MSNTIPPRIEREAEEYANKHGYRSNGVYDTTNDLEAAYEAGATTWAERAEKLKEALEKIKRTGGTQSAQIALTALENYKKELI